MRIFKLLSIFIFLAIFINGKANARILGIEIKKDHSSKKIVTDHTINSDDQDEDSARKLKRKPRCIEVDVPHIANIPFEQSFIFRDFIPSFIQNRYSSFLHCIPRKRGPPLS